MMQSGRDEKGRFASGNAIAKMGWHGLVQKRFEGDSVAAKEWLAQLGRHSYMMQTPIRRQHAFYHPGTPEQWLEEWRRRFEFCLADVGELKF